MQRRAAENELLAVGLELQRALLSYTALGGPPETLEALLRDARTPSLKRHLRRIPIDPLTGHATWGLVRDTSGRIVAVHSLALGHPIKNTGFPLGLSHFDNARSYEQWTFGLVRN
ncbi:MAG TPA: hypothetical protein VFS42_10755 [Burkholderiaceae bacterium]|nr:hypothetical protein [Burkholderiaceae bacterium]